MRLRSLAGALVVMTFAAPRAYAQETGAGDKVGVCVAQPGGGCWGTSAVVDLTAFKGDGTVSAFSSGIGGGVSYKWITDSHKYPFEVGAYFGPRVEVPSEGDTQATLALLVHGTLFAGFGLGAGYEIWHRGLGFFKQSGEDKFFITIGFTPSNSQ